MQRIEKEFEIAAPLAAVYSQWTQFEVFPRFMDGVKEVRQIDDTHFFWRASIAGKEEEWEAELTEQVHDRVIAWRSTSGAPNAGRVTFEPVGEDRTRLRLDFRYEPQTALEKAGDAMGLVSRKVDKTVDDFREYMESHRRETGAWRGAVQGGMTRPQGVAPTPPPTPGPARAPQGRAIRSEGGAK